MTAHVVYTDRNNQRQVARVSVTTGASHSRQRAEAAATLGITQRHLVSLVRLPDRVQPNR